MPTLEDTLTLANDVLAALANLINGAGSTTPIPDTGASYTTPLPMYNAETDTWTIMQDTPDTDGLYKGAYQLALDTACSVLTIHSVTGHTTPADPTYPPARYTDCGAVVHDLTSVTDLTGKPITHFEILSDTAFTVTLSLSATWD